jgi:hypothetical protein
MVEGLKRISCIHRMYNSRCGRRAASGSRSRSAHQARKQRRITFLAESCRGDTRALDLLGLAMRLATAPCSPLYSKHVSPGRELAALVLLRTASELTRGRRPRKSRHSAPVRASPGSGQGGIWVPGQEAVRRVVVNEGVVSQPLDGPAPGPGVPERVPRWQQARMLLVELAFEAAEGSLAPDRMCQPAPGTFIGDPIGEVGHVLVPDPDGSGPMTTRSSSSRSAGVWPSMPVSAVQNAISPVSGLISQWCS